jgi:hypothetical protein
LEVQVAVSTPSADRLRTISCTLDNGKEEITPFGCAAADRVVTVKPQ